MPNIKTLLLLYYSGFPPLTFIFFMLSDNIAIKVVFSKFLFLIKLVFISA